MCGVYGFEQRAFKKDTQGLLLSDELKDVGSGACFNWACKSYAVTPVQGDK